MPQARNAGSARSTLARLVTRGLRRRLVGLTAGLLVAAPADAAINRAQQVAGGGGSSPVSMPSIDAGTDQTYVLLVCTRTNRSVTDVSGGGLGWMPAKVPAQCSGRGEQGVSLFVAQGSPSIAFQVQITFDDAGGGSNLAAVLARYTGVGTVEDGTSANTNGESGACTGGTDSASAALTLDSTENDSVHVVGVNPYDQTIPVDPTNYALIDSHQQGGGPNLTGAYMYDRTMTTFGQDTCTATLSAATDWATSGIVLNPGTPPPPPSPSGGQSFVFLDPPVDVSPGGTPSSWEPVDVTPWVPAGATGVMVQFMATASNTKYGIRESGSTDTWMVAHSTAYAGSTGFLMTGLDANRVFQVYAEDTAVKTYLLGYTRAGVTFFTNAKDKSLTTTGTYQPINIAADTGAETAIGAILQAVSQSNASL
ncbi:MAG: hypothetical protein ACYSXF_08580, partial [Planctomycetota bacterium]